MFLGKRIDIFVDYRQEVATFTIRDPRVPGVKLASRLKYASVADAESEATDCVILLNHNLKDDSDQGTVARWMETLNLEVAIAEP
jgi:hypothetical protein